MYSGNDLKELKSKLNKKSFIKKFKENNIKHLYLTGSFSRGEQTNNSDIDFIYEIGEGGYKSGFSFIKMKLNLEEKLNREIDFIEDKFINSRIKKSLEKDKILIF